MRTTGSYLDIWIKKVIGAKVSRKHTGSHGSESHKSSHKSRVSGIPYEANVAEDNTEDIYENLIPKIQSLGPLNIEDLKSFLEKSKVDFDHSYQNRRVDNMEISDYNLIKAIGSGSFGTVILACSKKDDTEYAIKIVDKMKVLDKRHFRYMFNEKRILQAINFPFVIYLKYFFVDFYYLYYVMPHVPGGDFYYYLRKVKSFSNNDSKFYVGQLVLALEYLHYLGLVHRDVKPENIMLDALGYVKLADFGQCVKYSVKAWTFTGTPAYMAPEVILSEGYDVAADWWSLGVTLFELRAGYRPFKHQNRKKLYESILDVKFKMPPFNSALQNIIKKLLEPDPEKRLGNEKRGAKDVKNHIWFKDTDWLSLLNRTLKAPYVPYLKE